MTRKAYCWRIPDDNSPVLQLTSHIHRRRDLRLARSSTLCPAPHPTRCGGDLCRAKCISRTSDRRSSLSFSHHHTIATLATAATISLLHQPISFVDYQYAIMGNVKDNNVEFIEELEHTKTLDQVTTMGTVKLTDGAVVYIPTPTADPQDPLNCPTWQKWLILVIISCCKDDKSSPVGFMV